MIPADEGDLIEQSGTSPGFYAYVGASREDGAAVAVLADVAQPRLGALGRALLARARGKSVGIGLPEIAEQPASSKGDCVGTYDLHGTPLAVTQDEAGMLHVRMGDGTPARMYPKGVDTYFVTVDAAELTCLRKAEGVHALQLVRGERTVEAPRLPR